MQRDIKMSFKYTIIKRGRVGVIDPLPIGRLAIKLKSKFSYMIKGYEFMPNPSWGKVELYKGNTGRFPWGLHNRIFEIIKSVGYDPEYEEDILVKLNEERIKNLNPRLRDYQKNAILALILNKGGLVCLPTGAGKTYTFLEYARYMNKKTLVIVPSLDLVKQWGEQIKDDKNIEVTNHHKLIKNKSIVRNYEVVCYDECLHYRSNILTDKGRIKIGSLVNNFDKYKYIKAWSYNIKKKKFEWKEIVRVFKKEEDKLLRIEYSKRRIICTHNHRILTNNGYKRADELKEGDSLSGYYKDENNLGYAKITNIKKIKNDEKYVYNLEVKDNHNYVISGSKNDEGIIVSNCHMTPAKTIYKVMNSIGNAISVGLTATPYREDKEDLKIYAAVGEMVYNISRKELIERGYIADAEVRYIKLENHEKSRFIKYHDIYNAMIVNNGERNYKILKSVLNNKNKKILILVSRIEHGEVLNTLLLEAKQDNVFLNGSMKERNIKDTDDVVIATSIFDQGVDLKKFDFLILAAGGQSSVQLVQRIGRVLRPKKDGHKSVIIDFMDESKYLKKHYVKRRKILEEEFDVTEV